MLVKHLELKAKWPTLHIIKPLEIYKQGLGGNDIKLPMLMDEAKTIHYNFDIIQAFNFQRQWKRKAGGKYWFWVVDILSHFMTEAKEEEKSHTFSRKSFQRI